MRLFQFIVVTLTGLSVSTSAQNGDINSSPKFRRNIKHVGPPSRDAAFHGSLNASVQSDTAAAYRVRKNCATVVTNQLEAGVNNLIRQIHFHDIHHQGIASLRRKIALLGMCYHGNNNDDTQQQQPIQDGKFRKLMGLSFAFYKKAMRARDAIYFLHISKAGGTSFCANSYENSCRDPNYGDGNSASSWRWNCWSKTLFNGPKWVILPETASKFDKRKVWWGIPSSSGEGSSDHEQEVVLSTSTWSHSLVKSHDLTSPSCRDHRDEVVSKNISFLMNENWLPEFGRLCDTFMNIVIFRNPIDRILSHRIYLKGLQLKLEDPIPLDMTSFYSQAFVISDNFYIRVLCGEDVYRLPAGNLTTKHLKHALNVIKEFDIILILEKMKVHSPIVLRRGFGWANNKLPSLNQKSKTADMIETSSEDMKFITTMNHKDIILYEKASELAELDFEYFRQVELIDDHDLKVFEKEFIHVRVDMDSSPHECLYTCGYSCLRKERESQTRT